MVFFHEFRLAIKEKVVPKICNIVKCRLLITRYMK